jgi:hypothetical protein
VEGWNSSDGNPDAGIGGLGACCAEMDICKFEYLRKSGYIETDR